MKLSQPVERIPNNYQRAKEEALAMLDKIIKIFQGKH